MKRITVRITKNYGNEAIYPVSKEAQVFALIAGTKTLSRHLLKMIQGLGYEVKVEQQAL